MHILRVACAFLVAFAAAGQPATFTNPLLPAGADPWSIHMDGWYYYTHTTGQNITLWRTRSLAELGTAERKVVWTPPPDGPYSKQVWAPELHFLGGKWYVYFAADDGQNRNHRLWVLENPSVDPFTDNWTLKGKLATPEDRWAIDGSVFEHQGKMYLVWSGWEGTENGRQDLYIARLQNPWTTTGPRMRISTPEFDWERIGDIPKPGPDDKLHVDVNEGPQPLVRNGRVFIIYSASGCWTDHYALGMIHAESGTDLMAPGSWRKHPVPVFKAGGQSSPGTFAAGHNSFFKSPDGTEDWILYHANPGPGMGCGGRRSPRAQRFAWTPQGFPDFGKPVAAGVKMPVPSAVGK
ncbi:MAG TPA: glycoside hydrolase family 43 protein [Bryobacteraceae bacterium]|nr:glycoside hydrolase family 43 protein [Bryobacteraceae bacterium]